jgi:hypothetical protein
MNKLELTKEEAKNIISEENEENYDIVHQEISYTSRWTIYYDIVIYQKSTGKYFKDEYSVGATEIQNERPYDRTIPDFTEVFPHTVETIVYKTEPELDLETIIKEFIKSYDKQMVLEVRPLEDYNLLFKSWGYKAEPFDDFNGCEIDFWWLHKHKTLPNLELYGSLHYGNYKLKKHED